MQFKDASDDFNIQAQGVNLKPVQEAFSKCKGRFDDNILEVKDGIVRVSEDGKNLIEDGSRIYTKSEKQNEVYKMAQSLSELINEALDKKIVRKLDKPNLEQTFKIITQPSGKNNFAPDYLEISRL